MSEWKETEYGKIPANWNFISATRFCENVTDGTHDSPKRQKAGKFLITSKHIKGRNIDFKNAYLISIADFKKINERSKVDQWDVIISMIGEYCGFAFLERNSNIDYAIKNVGLFKTGDKDNALWLYYYIQSRIGNHYLQTNKSGTSQPYITLGTLRELPILVPSNPNEQKAIAAVLSSLDDKIDLLHRQNKTLEALAETLFRQWFIAPFGGAQGGKAQDDWEEKSLGECVETTSGGTPSRKIMDYFRDGKIKWVKSKELGGSFIVDTEEKITEDALKNSAAKILPANSILIAMYGATVGEYAIIQSEMTCNQAVCALIPNEDYPYTFLFIFIKHFKNELINMAVGSAQQNINQILIKNFPVYASKKLIILYHENAEPVFDKIKQNIIQIRTLEKLRDTLLPKLMSGEVRVKV